MTRSKPPSPIPTSPHSQRMVWWAELIQIVLYPGLILAVYLLAGGDGTDLTRPLTEQIEQPSRPALVAAVVMVAAALLMFVAAQEARVAEHRRITRWYRIQHPEAHLDAGVVLPVVEQILRELGPQRFVHLRAELARRGVQVDKAHLVRILSGEGERPGSWLTPRELGEPYSHVDNPYTAGGSERPAAAEEPGVDAGRESLPAMMEELVRLCGPISFDQMHQRLHAGGPWGPPLRISKLAMGKLLRAPGGGPAVWIAERVDGSLYDHVDNVAARRTV